MLLMFLITEKIVILEPNGVCSQATEQQIQNELAHLKST